VHPLEKVLLALPYETSSLESFDRLLAWCQTCTENHPKCGPGSSAVLPNRVLYIKFGLEGPQIQLVDGAGKTGKYVCLSHCWGSSGSQPLRLTKSMKSLFEQGIQWSSIPQTFRDVILLVRRLGIEFLWIDSLCIVQDDDEDWNREAAAMSDIYQNSWLTIAATASKDCNQGLYSDLDDFHYCANELKNSRFIRLSPEHPFPGQSRNMMGFPLLSRGWVYQERLLPPRVVHFTLNELIFECCEGFWCSCGIYKSQPPDQKIPKVFYNKMILKGGPDNLHRWHEIVSEYSSLTLTFAKDKLPAISGIAKQLKSTCGLELGDYLAGLWEGNIEFDLLWYATHRGQISQNVRSISAPSWSWASINGAVAFENPASLHRSNQYTIELLRHNISTKGPDNFGELRSGHLTISGFVATGSIASGAGGHSFRLQGLSLSPNFIPNFMTDYSLDKPGDGPEEIFFLMIGVDFNPIHEDAPFSLFLGLRCVNPALNHFERIGIGYTPKKYFDEDWMKAWAEKKVITLV
jgi:hypothetical protein